MRIQIEQLEQDRAALAEAKKQLAAASASSAEDRASTVERLAEAWSDMQLTRSDSYLTLRWSGEAQILRLLGKRSIEIVPH